MENQFRDRVVKLGEKGLEIMEEYFDGKRSGTDKVKDAGKIIGFAVKISHMNQLKTATDRSQAIRLLQFIPKEQRANYIALTNPEAKPFLLSKPEPKGKK